MKRLVRDLAEEEFVPVRDMLTEVVSEPRDEGVMCELISRAKSGSEDLWVGVLRLAPGEHHARHHHPHGSEFYFFSEGECTVHVDGQDVRVDPGSVVYIPSDCVHSIRNDSDQNAEVVFGFSKPSYAECGHEYDE